jgi:hypothetical protein
MTKPVKTPVTSTPDHGVRRAQELVRAYIPKSRQISEELIAERRDEASRE